MAQLGNNILVYLNGNGHAGTKSNEIQTDCETLEVTNPFVSTVAAVHRGPQAVDGIDGIPGAGWCRHHEAAEP